MKKRHLIGIIIIVIFVLGAGIALAGNLTPYVTFTEARAKNATVQVHGTLEGEVQTLAGQGISFFLKDDDGVRAQINYKGLKPDNMDQSEGVVVIGKFDGAVFNAEKILIKCPSKYESQAGGGT